MRCPVVRLTMLLPVALLVWPLGGCGGDGSGAGGIEPRHGILFVRQEASGSEEEQAADAATAEIRVMDPDGSDHAQLTRNGLVDSDPKWSPGGTRILFVRRATAAGGPWTRARTSG
jgi:hypothetical protein